MFSINNKLVVEPYKKEALKSTVKGGLAYISQKMNLKGLKLLMPAHLADGQVIPVGSTVYVREEILYTSQWATKNYECDALQEFLIIELNVVDFIVPPKEYK